MKASLYYRYKWWEQRRRYRRWETRGKPMPPPHFVKQLAIKDLARRHGLRVLVETGTYRGEMVRAMAGGFDRIYSIELDRALFLAVQEQLRRRRHVRLLLGDSTSQLPQVLAELDGPALFWLDAHYTGAHAGRADVNTPIMRELAAVAAHAVKSHVVLIDDARLFTGGDDYPTLALLHECTQRLFPQHVFEVLDDIIRLTPHAT